MKYRKFELFIALLLTAISFFGDYYLSEPLVKDVSNHSLTWYTMDMVWLLAMAVIGYWGLIDHELKWVKFCWIITISALLFLMLSDKITRHFWHYAIISKGVSNLVRSPFLYVMAAFLPRWFNMYKTSKER